MSSKARKQEVSGVRLFIIFSVALHLVFATAWGIPEYYRRVEEKDQVETAKRILDQREENDKRIEKKLRRVAVQQTAEEITAELKKDYDRIVKHDFEEEEADKRWEKLQKDLEPDVKTFAEKLAEPDRPERELREAMTDLKKEMVEKLYEQVTGDKLARKSERLHKALEEKIIPEVAAHYKKEIERKIGRPLFNETHKLVRGEQKMANLQKPALLKSLDHAQLEARAARDAVADAEKQADNRAQSDKRIAQAKGSLERTQYRLENAAKRAEHFSADLADQIDAAKLKELAAAIEKRSEASSARAKDDRDLKLKSAVKSAEELAKAIDQLHADVAEAVDYDPAELAKATLGEYIGVNGRHAIDEAFKKGFEEKVVDRMAEALAKSMKLDHVGEAMGDDGEGGMPSTKIGLANTLGKGVPSLVAAGATATAGLEAKLGLANIDPAILESSIRSDDIRAGAESAFSKAAKEWMDQVLADKRVDGVLAKSLNAHFRDDPQLLDLSARLASLADNLEEGRLGFFEASGDLFNLRRVRSDAIDRSQYLSHLSHTAYIFKTSVYEEMTRGIHSRDKKAASGEKWSMNASVGSQAAAEVELDTVRPGTIIVAGSEEVSVPGTKPYEPTFKTIQFGTAAYAGGTITLDGDLSDWEAVPGMPMYLSWVGAMQKDLKAADAQFVKIAWDNRGIYFAFEVKDPNNQIDKVNHLHFWEGDTVEIFTDALNTKDRRRGNAWTQQFWVWPFGHVADESKMCGEAQWTAAQAWNWVPHRQDFIQKAAAKTEDGWNLEVLVPAERMNQLTLESGRIIGLNLSICTGTSALYYWAGSSAVHPSDHPDTWGDLMFAGADGQMSLLGEDEEKVLIVGDDLELKIEDPDMNLSALAKDRLSVVVSSASGDSETVVLDETGVSTGVFRGSLGTAFSMGEPMHGILSLGDGDRVEVLYLDQARADGSRSVELKLSLTAAAGVVSIGS